MNRTEQKERLTYILEGLDDTVIALDSVCDVYEDSIEHYTAIYERLSEEGIAEDILENDVEDFTQDVIKALLNNKTEFSEVLGEIETFKEELEEYKEEISEQRAEALEERYEDLEEVYDNLYDLTENAEDMDHVIGLIKETIPVLKAMKK